MTEGGALETINCNAKTWLEGGNFLLGKARANRGTA